MNENPPTGRNVRVFAALMIGVALVVGAYILATFGETNGPQIQDATNAVVVAPAPERQYIPTQDSDGDGLRDWEEALVRDNGTISLTEESEYVPPETLTEQFGIAFLQDTIRAKGYGAFGDSDEVVVQKAVDSLAEQTADTLYTTDDLTITADNSTESIMRYGNRVAMIIIENSTDAENEAVIMQNALTLNDPTMLEDLEPIANTYRTMRDEMLAMEVPSNLAREHLDLLNIFQAILTDVEAMQQAFSDPLLTMMRMKRYPDDAAGLFFALQNMYLALVATEAPFTLDDPASLFLKFQPPV